MKKILVLCVLVFSLSANKSSAQDYTSALGVKFWDGGGISFKHFFSEQNALELIGFFWSRGMRITGLYEIHGDISGATGLRWYIGPGAHVGFYNDRYGGGSFVGVDGVIGLDYTFSGAPINLALDWQPSIEFASNRGFTGSWAGFAIRYTFPNK